MGHLCQYVQNAPQNGLARQFGTPSGYAGGIGRICARSKEGFLECISSAARHTCSLLLHARCDPKEEDHSTGFRFSRMDGHLHLQIVG